MSDKRPLDDGPVPSAKVHRSSDIWHDELRSNRVICFYLEDVEDANPDVFLWVPDHPALPQDLFDKFWRGPTEISHKEDPELWADATVALHLLTPSKNKDCEGYDCLEHRPLFAAEPAERIRTLLADRSKEVEFPHFPQEVWGEDKMQVPEHVGAVRPWLITVLDPWYA